MPIIKRAAAAPEAPQQHNQKSRKGKKAWRKNVDVTEIDAGLEAVRDEVIKGGIISEKQSDDLFMLDVDGDASIAKKFLKASKPLKADEIIAQRSAVPSVSMRKRPGDKTTNGIADPKRQRVSYVSHKELTRLRNIMAGKGTQSVVEVTDPAFDPWSEDADAKALVVDERFSFLPKEQKKVAPATLKQKPISLAASGKAVPAVSKPAGGFSYNPVYTEYEQRLIAAGDKELEAEKKRIAIAEAERLRAEASAKSAAEATAAEARAELSEWDEESAWEGLESGAEDTRVSAKRPERKTHQQRNKIARRKEEERKQKMLANNKKRNEQAQHIKKIAKSVEEAEEARALALSVQAENADDESEGEDLELRRRKLGKLQLPEKELELVLPDELTESLRLLKPEGNALKERYRSLLVRGKVEGRKRISFAKQAKRKTTEKWTHKDFMLH
ncbi:hypothetical protein V497_03518 [Pseudogymnoascus sp. VKM F-4516 (FW-969)]|nr:hypothetical protein V497_03518 [Pseudogymnoascus sp. VKM F-4516 (FW-969)]